MKNFTIYEYKKVINGSITLSFTPLKESIMVKNGEVSFIPSESINNKLYIDSKFNNKVLSVEYIHENANNVKVVSASPNVKTLFKRTSNNDNLIFNNKYEAYLELDGEKFISRFYSKLDPLYASVSDVRMDTGTLLEEYSDFVINNCIHKNSILAYEYLQNSNSDDDYSFESDTEITVTTAAKQYVRYKTDLDLVNAKYLSIVGNYGTVTKKISSLDISYEQELPELADMLSYFKDKVKEYEDELKVGSTTSIAVDFVRSSSNDYPIDSRNSF